MKLFIAMIVALVLPLQLVGAVPVHAAGTITFTPPSAPPGQTVGVKGTGFPVSDSLTITEQFLSAQTQTATSDTGGTFTTFFTVPAGTPSGNYTVTVIDALSTRGTGTFTVTGGAALALNPSANVLPSASATVTGTGFTASSPVTLRLSYTNTSGVTQTKDTNSFSTSPSGAFSATVTIPTDARAGPFTVNAYYGTAAGGTVVASANGTIAAHAAIILAPSTGPAGTTTSVTVSGTGFGSNETVTINYTATLTTSNGAGNTSPESISAQTNTSGAFSATLPVPSNIVPGTYTITATGTTSNLQTNSTLTITPHPAISLNPTAAAPGTVVVVTGQLFAPNLGVTVSATIPTSTGNVNLSGQTSADAAGAFSARLFVPSNAISGTVTVTATEPQAPGGASSATATLTIRGLQGTITASPLSAAPGTIVTISGTGFSAGPNATVTITASIPIVGGGSQAVSTTVDTDSNGAFTGAQLLIPSNAAAGGVTLSASQPSSGATATTNIAIVVLGPSPTPTATPTPSPTPTSTPTATATPTSTPTATPAPQPAAGLHFQHLSVWYHVVRVGTFNHVEVQANLKTKLGIWVHVLFPSGRHWDYFEHTNGRGHWARTFDIPYNSMSRFTARAHIELQLWKGKTTVKDFMPFTIIP